MTTSFNCRLRDINILFVRLRDSFHYEAITLKLMQCLDLILLPANRVLLKCGGAKLPLPCLLVMCIELPVGSLWQHAIYVSDRAVYLPY
jgi:hypothetical protein